MQPTPQQGHKTIDELLQVFEASGEDVHAMAESTRTLVKRRKIRTVQQSLLVILLYVGLDKVLREVAAIFTLRFSRITDEGIRQHLLKTERFIDELCAMEIEARRRRLDDGSWSVWICDGSTVTSPGRSGYNRRLHLAIDLHTLKIVDFLVTDEKHRETVEVFAIPERTVLFFDRGFCHRKPVARIMTEGTQVVGRFNPWSFPCYKAEGDGPAKGKEAKWTAKRWATYLKKLPVAPGMSHTEAIVLRPHKRAPWQKAWVHILALPEEQANKARRKYRRRCRDEGKTPNKTALVLKGFVFVLTSLPPDVVDGQTVLGWYRRRWQIECAIKRYKSILKAGQLRHADDSPMLSIWLKGKLLYTILLHKRSDAQWLRRQPPQWQGQRRITPWRTLKLVKCQFDHLVLAVDQWRMERVEIALEVLAERKRRRKLQPLDDDIRAKLAGLRDVPDIDSIKEAA